MTQITLTGADIKADIEGYQDRLSKAQRKLSELPAGLKGRKLAQTQRVLLADIKHVRTLIGYAEEALGGLAG